MVNQCNLLEINCQPQRKQWYTKELPHKNGINIYTDGSSKNNKIGGGIYCVELQWYFAITCNCKLLATSVYSEILPLLVAAKMAVRAQLSNKKINFYCDSASALRQIKNSTATNGIINTCKLWLQKLSATNHIKILWVPGHCGIMGNEMADAFSKFGRENEMAAVDGDYNYSLIHNNW